MPWGFLLKGIKLSWYEWLFIGALIVLAISYYTTSQRLKETSEKLILADQRAAVAAKDVKVVSNIRELEDTLANELQTDYLLTKQQREERTLDFETAYRTEIKRHETEKPAPEPVVAIHPEPVVATAVKPNRPPAAQNKPVVKPPVVDTQRVRVGLIAKRLFKSYCTAGGVSPDCTPKTTDAGLSVGSSAQRGAAV